MKYIEVPPFAPSLMESTRAIGYSLETAIADIIDNSVAAGSTSVSIEFFPINGEYISILDNGDGMDASELVRAMQYGSRNPNELRDESDLGRFGLGLKTASLSQCKKLTVLSKKNGIIEGRRWDLDFVVEKQSWALIVLNQEEMEILPQYEKLLEQKDGTLVIWQNLDRMKIGEIDFEESMGRKMDDVRDHLALVYHRYLSGEKGIKKLTVTINGEKIKPIDPFYQKKSTKPMDAEVLSIEGEKVVVQPFILPHTSKLTKKELDLIGGKEGLRKLQGFYVYRNKRLLVWGTWFRLMRQGETSKLVRIMVDIPNSLDSLWTLDIKKSSAVPPEEVRRNLKPILESVAEKSKRTWTFRGKKEVSDKTIHLWDRKKTNSGGHIYTINEDYPLVKDLINENPSCEKKIKQLLSYIESELPLNSLYLDLTNDVKIENENDVDLNEIIQAVRDMLKTMPLSKRASYFDELLKTEPFINYKVELEDNIKLENDYD